MRLLDWLPIWPIVTTGCHPKCERKVRRAVIRCLVLSMVDKLLTKTSAAMEVRAPHISLAQLRSPPGLEMQWGRVSTGTEASSSTNKRTPLSSIRGTKGLKNQSSRLTYRLGVLVVTRFTPLLTTGCFIISPVCLFWARVATIRGDPTNEH